MGKNYVTKSGLEKLKEELRYLKFEKMPQIVDRIATAKELGDLSENAEYHDAKDEQGFVAGRIVELENLIQNSEVIENNQEAGVVGIGNTIRVTCDGKEFTYTIVGFNEANPTQGLISNESPIGRAFLGRKVGEKVTVKVPNGDMACEVLEIK